MTRTPNAIDWCAVICSPDGPAVPFGSPLLILLDSVRVACYVLAFALIVMTPQILLACHNWGQRTRFMSLMIFAFAAVGTEIDHLGDYANYRLVLNTFALAFAAYGFYSFIRREAPTEIRQT